jgi:hypothetical protein
MALLRSSADPLVTGMSFHLGGYQSGKRFEGRMVIVLARSELAFFPNDVDSEVER